MRIRTVSLVEPQRPLSAEELAAKGNNDYFGPSGMRGRYRERSLPWWLPQRLQRPLLE